MGSKPCHGLHAADASLRPCLSPVVLRRTWARMGRCRAAPAAPQCAAPPTSRPCAAPVTPLRGPCTASKPLPPRPLSPLYPQAETYRRMKRATKNRWAAHVPATNVFWMQYLVDTCLTEVGWAPPHCLRVVRFRMRHASREARLRLALGHAAGGCPRCRGALSLQAKLTWPAVLAHHDCWRTVWRVNVTPPAVRRPACRRRRRAGPAPGSSCPSCAPSSAGWGPTPAAQSCCLMTSCVPGCWWGRRPDARRPTLLDHPWRALAATAGTAWWLLATAEAAGSP